MKCANGGHVTGRVAGGKNMTGVYTEELREARADLRAVTKPTI